MTAKLIFHTGYFPSFDKHNKNVYWRFVGDMSNTSRQLSKLGYGLYNDITNEDVHIFSNDENVFNGLRLSILDENISVDSIEMIFYTFVNDDEVITPETIVINENATIPHWPKGFFDQTGNDIAEILIGQSRSYRKSIQSNKT